MKNIGYKIFKKYRQGFGLFYRALKKVVRYSSCYHIHTDCILKGMQFMLLLQNNADIVDKHDVRRYKNKWKVLSSKVPEVFMQVYPSISGVKSSDYVPASLFFTHIEPMLNNVEYSRSFADKNLYSLLIGTDVLPKVLLRKMHGMYLDNNYEKEKDVDRKLSEIASENSRVVLKPAISSQGGKNISIIESDGDRLLKGNTLVDREWLDKNYSDNFLLQAHVSQHPFYAQFNASSLNTLRVYTYRSVRDENVHVLQSVLRVGQDGAVVDNVKMGGRACGMNRDGSLNGIAYDRKGKLLDRIGKVDLKNGNQLFKFDEVARLACKIAEKQFYSRLIGFDFCVDAHEEVRLIEINNYDVGVDSLQACNGPLFREFTNEVIDYCKTRKKNFKYIIR